MNNEATTQEKSAVKEVALENVAVQNIEVVENVRKHFDAAAMKELTESIRQNGVLVPILLAKNGKPGVYRLIAGERRLRAAKSLALESVPAQIVEADQSKLDELQVLENLHRADLGPIEEARAFKKLLDQGKRSIEGLAKQVDKSVKYVTRSVRLLELPRKAVQAIEKGVISPEHGHQILRLPEDRREKMVDFALTPDWRNQFPTVDALARQIEQRAEKDLKAACFPKDKEYAGQMACVDCPFNTGNQDALFEGATAGKCTNGGCFAKKTAFFLKEYKEKAAKRFDGLEFVGMGSSGWNGLHEIKGAVVLKEDEAKSEKVKALIQKEPKKFGFAVVKPSMFGAKAPSAVLVCKEKELLEKEIRKSKDSGQRAPTREEMEREQFLREAEVRALYAEAAKAVKCVKKKHLLDIVLALNGADAAYAAIGVSESDDLAKTLAKLSEKDLLRLAWLCSLDAYNPDEGLSEAVAAAPKVRKEARKLALAEWEEAMKAKAAVAQAKEVPADKK
ncbi:MAG: ParB/RepB/Spo0J family partition protein [Elusimicrobia bacterium]|nr:ParB/RepB/Spo0J family partition protein [Elusimicrobiota bacterium]